MNLISFDGERQKDEWCSGLIDPKLARIFLEAANFYWNTFGKTFMVTSIKRTAEEDTALGGHGVHVVWRAIDIAAPAWSDKPMATVATHVNLGWVYDPVRPNLKVALFEPHGTGPHLHLQVHRGTEAR